MTLGGPRGHRSAMVLSAVFLLTIALPGFLGGVGALRFAHHPVTVDTGIVLVGQEARLTCNYVKFRTESVREISWFVGYGGVKSKVLTYNVGTNRKESTFYNFVRVLEDTATDSQLTIILPEYRSEVLSLGCEIEALRDNGYGKVKDAKKLGETEVMVVDASGHQLALIPGAHDGTPSGDNSIVRTRFASPGHELAITCLTRGSSVEPNLTLSLGGRNLEDMPGGRVRRINKGNSNNEHSKEGGVVGYLDPVLEEHFADNGEAMVVECVARFQDYMLAKKQITLTKSYDSDQLKSTQYHRMNSDQYPSNSRDASQGNADDDAGWRRDRSRFPSDESRQGRYNHGYEDNLQDHHSLKPRLSESSAPSMSAQRGWSHQPADLQVGYLVLVGKGASMMHQPEVPYGHASSSYGGGSDASAASVVLGPLPSNVRSVLEGHYGRYRRVHDSRTEIKMDPVEVLNVLGGLGYRVVGVAAAPPGGGGQFDLAWTLEQRTMDGVRS